MISNEKPALLVEMDQKTSRFSIMGTPKGKIKKTQDIPWRPKKCLRVVSNTGPFVMSHFIFKTKKRRKTVRRHHQLPSHQGKRPYLYPFPNGVIETDQSHFIISTPLGSWTLFLPPGLSGYFIISTPLGSWTFLGQQPGKLLCRVLVSLGIPGMGAWGYRPWISGG